MIMLLYWPLIPNKYDIKNINKLTTYVHSVKGDIYVSDEANHTISIFNSEGNFLSRWGKQGSEKGRFNGPAGISFDPEGNIVVVDSINQNIPVRNRNPNHHNNSHNGLNTQICICYPHQRNNPYNTKRKR